MNTRRFESMDLLLSSGDKVRKYKKSYVKEPRWELNLNVRVPWFLLKE